MAAKIFHFSLAISFKNLPAAFKYASLTGAGIGLMIMSLLLRKALDTLAPNVIVDSLSFLSLGILVIGALWQTSATMLPGLVYNAITHKPIGLAVVRIVRICDNKILESRVTNEHGRYGMIVAPGSYKVIVDAKNYIFPAKGIEGYKVENLEMK